MQVSFFRPFLFSSLLIAAPGSILLAQKIRNINYTHSGDSIEINYEAHHFVKDLPAFVTVLYSLDHWKTYEVCVHVKGDAGKIYLKPQNKLIWDYKDDHPEINGNVEFKIDVRKQPQFSRVRFYFNIGNEFPIRYEREGKILLKTGDGISARFGLQSKRRFGAYFDLGILPYHIQFDTGTFVNNHFPFSGFLKVNSMAFGIDYLLIRRDDFWATINLGLGLDSKNSDHMGIHDQGLGFGLLANYRRLNFLLDFQKLKSFGFSYGNTVKSLFYVNQVYRITKFTFGIGYTF